MEEARDILLLLGREGSTGALGQSSGRAGSSNDGSTTPTPSSTVPSTSPTPLNSLDSLRRTVSDALPRRSPVQVEFINPIYSSGTTPSREEITVDDQPSTPPAGPLGV